MKRVVIAIIAILVAVGLTGCTTEYRIPYEDLELRCEVMEEALSDISWIVEDAHSALTDLSEGSTGAWAVLTGHEEINDETLWDAVNDLENSWKDENELRDLLNEIQSIADDARRD